MKLIHYSKIPVVLNREKSYEQTACAKPCGFWISIDGNGDGWREWCESEGFRLPHLTHHHEIVLHESARILRLSSASDIDKFSTEYVQPSKFGSFYIKWFDVAEKFQGIVIAPYIWSRRLHDSAQWYYGWDCASGCIWDLAAIEKINDLGTDT